MAGKSLMQVTIAAMIATSQPTLAANVGEGYGGGQAQSDKEALKLPKAPDEVVDKLKDVRRSLSELMSVVEEEGSRMKLTSSQLNAVRTLGERLKGMERSLASKQMFASTDGDIRMRQSITQLAQILNELSVTLDQTGQVKSH